MSLGLKGLSYFITARSTHMIFTIYIIYIITLSYTHHFIVTYLTSRFIESKRHKNRTLTNSPSQEDGKTRKTAHRTTIGAEGRFIALQGVLSFCFCFYFVFVALLPVVVEVVDVG